MSDLRYPIGKFTFDGSSTEADRQKFADDSSRRRPSCARRCRRFQRRGSILPTVPVAGPCAKWCITCLTVILNSYVRFKLALTEDEPTIKPYYEDRWVELQEAKTAPIELSLALLDSLHKRWVLMLRSMKSEDWKRTFRHPDLGVVSLEKNVALYSWHGRHHVAHITSLGERMGW